MQGEGNYILNQLPEEDKKLTLTLKEMELRQRFQAKTFE